MTDIIRQLLFSSKSCMAAKILSTNTLVRISGSKRLSHHPARPEAPQETSFGSSTFGKDR